MIKTTFLFILLLLYFSFIFPQTLPYVEWIQSYSSGSCRDILRSSDGNYILVGNNAYTYYGSGDLVYIKIDSSGIELDSYINSDVNGSANYIFEYDDIFCYVAGYADNHGFLEEIDIYFNSYNFNTYTDYHEFTVIDTYNYSSLVIGGWDIFGLILNVDLDGNPNWFIHHPDESHIWDDYLNSIVTDIEILDNGDIMLAGFYDSYYVEENTCSNFLIRADSLGNEIWYIDFINFTGNQTNPTKFLITEDSEFVTTVSFNEVCKISSDGNEIWRFDVLDYFCRFSSIKKVIINGIVYYYLIGNIRGQGYSNFCLVKLNDDGELVWDQIYDFDTIDYIYDFIVMEDNSFLLAGSSDGQFSVIKLSSDETSLTNHETQYTAELNQNCPNPFNPETEITYTIHEESTVALDVYNLKGQLIKKLYYGYTTPGDYSLRWDASDYNERKVGSGVYLIKLITNGESVYLKKCLLLK